MLPCSNGASFLSELFWKQGVDASYSHKSHLSQCQWWSIMCTVLELRTKELWNVLEKGGASSYSYVNLQIWPLSLFALGQDKSRKHCMHNALCHRLHGGWQVVCFQARMLLAPRFLLCHTAYPVKPWEFSDSGMSQRAYNARVNPLAVSFQRWLQPICQY